MISLRILGIEVFDWVTSSLTIHALVNGKVPISLHLKQNRENISFRLIYDLSTVTLSIDGEHSDVTLILTAMALIIQST